MIVYLDPTLYIYGSQEWADYSFVGRLEALIAALRGFRKIETELCELYKIFRFRTCDELSLAIYENNPMANNPEIPLFYLTQFRSKILPQLLQRMDLCPTVGCAGSPELAGVGPLEVVDLGNPIARIFHALLQRCEFCGHIDERHLVYYEQWCSLPPGAGYFVSKMSLPSAQLADSDHVAAERIYLAASDPVMFLPRFGERAYSAIKLNKAIRCSYEILANSDDEWKLTKVGEVSAMDDFWLSVERADFRGHEAKYKSRILYAITQISCGRDVTISSHRMKGWDVSHEGAMHPVWNAYVFKMGLNDQDKRCSRVYFIRTSSGAVLWQYEPDAHP